MSSVRDDNVPRQGDGVAAFESVLGKVKTAAWSAVKQTIGSGLDDIIGRYKRLRPVYKVMITVPVGVNEIEPYRYILADTSRPFVNFHNKSGSPIIGMWIDQSDLTEPDKAIILMENPVIHESGIQEQDFVNFPQYGVRNWLDIWMGYTPVLTGVDKFMSLAEMVGSTIGINLPETITKYNVAYTIPDTFMFGNESHVFSGPIVSVKRDSTASGDRLQIVGFSPSMILKSLKSNGVNIIVDSDTRPSLWDAIEQIIGIIMPYERGLSEEELSARFHMGRFPWYMFTGGTGGDGPFRISPFYKGGIEPGEELLGIYSEIWFDHSNIESGMREKKLRVGLRYPKSISLYDLLFDVLDNAALHGGGGLCGTILPAQGGHHSWPFKDGVGHPGVYVKYGYEFGITGIKGAIKKGTFSPKTKQTLTLGMNAREFEMGIEYGAVYNQREFMVKTADLGKAKPHLCPDGSEFSALLPTSPNPMSELIDPYGPDARLWNALNQDIYVFGPALHPTRSWIWGKDNNPVDLADKNIARYVARGMRETYFTGMSGTIFAIGDSSMKPGRILEIKDERTRLMTAAEDKVVGLVRQFVRNKIGTKVTASLPMFKMKNTDKNYYIWKVRHYLGTNSGYVSKVYYMEERNRSWQKYTESIDSIIRQATLQAAQLMGGRRGEI